MTNNTRVYNVTRGFTMKHKQALRAVEECAAAWVVEGVSVRDLTLYESIAARMQQVRRCEPLALAELPGLRFDAPEGEKAMAADTRRLVAAANRLVLGQSVSA